MMKKIISAILRIIAIIITWILWQLILAAILLCILVEGVKIFGITDTFLIVCYTLVFCCISTIIFIDMNDLFQFIWGIDRY